MVIAFYRLTFSHFLIQLVQSGFNKLPAIWGRLPTPFDFGHFAVFSRKYNNNFRTSRLDWVLESPSVALQFDVTSGGPFRTTSTH